MPAMPTPTPAALGLYALLLPAGLLGPGWLLGRLLRAPAGALGAFLGSAALLLNLGLALDALGLELSRAHLGGALAAVALGLLLATARNHPPAAATVTPTPVPRAALVLLLPAALGLAAIWIKAGLDPLAGLDTKFRWNFLATQMTRLGHLGFYPPVSETDFLEYPWCDGIAPLVSSLYHWAYVSLGSPVIEATFPIVAAQAGLLFWAVFTLAAGRGGPAAGVGAVAVLGTSAAFLSGIAIGQETGLTALALVGLFVFLERHRTDGHRGWLVWAGIAAGVGGLAREYGLAFTALGLLTLAGRGTQRRDWLTFLGAAVTVASPWYLRNWLRTGHPLFSHELGGLFPVNPVHVRHLQAIGEVFGLTGHPEAGLLLTAVPLLAGVPLALGLAGLLRHGRREWPWVAAGATLVVLWAWSVHQTAGGYLYSLRVLTPVLALAAVFAGLLLARAAVGRWCSVLVAVLTLAAADAALRTLFMPLHPWVTWWEGDWLAWRNHRRVADRWEANGNWAALAESAGDRLVLTNDPFVWELLHRHGAHPVPVYSPGVRHLLAEPCALGPAISRLRNEGFRFVVVTELARETTLFLEGIDFFRQLRRLPPSAELPFGHVYDLYDARWRTPPPPAPR